MAAELADRDRPVAAAVAAGLREPARRRARRGGARRGAALGERGAVGDERARDGDANEHGAGAAGERRAAAELPGRAVVGEGGERHDRQQERAAEEALRLAGREAPLQGAYAGERRHRGDREGGRDERGHGGARLRPRGGEDDEDDEPDRSRGQSSAGEAQVDPEAERRGGGRGGHAQPGGPRAVAGDPRDEHEPDHGERARRVPVGQRLLETAAGPRARRQVHHAGKDSPGEPVADDDERARGGAAASRRRGPGGRGARARASGAPVRGSAPTRRSARSRLRARRARAGPRARARSWAPRGPGRPGRQRPARPTPPRTLSGGRARRTRRSRTRARPARPAAPR